MRFLGLYREREYSPGRHRSNDVWLLEAVGEGLRAAGSVVELAKLDAVTRADTAAALVFSMCQGRIALERLADWEQRGARIVNNPRAALNTHRDRLPAVMAAAGVAFPKTTLVSTSVRDAVDVGSGVWLKRGDVHASVPADVQWIDSSDALERGLADFASRGVRLAAVQTHCEGDEIKFYGIGRGRFFHWFYPRTSRGYRFEHGRLVRLTARAAAAAGLEIYGGDVIVSPSGELTLIDLNDWPSFAPYRDAAANAITDYLMRRMHAVWHAGVVAHANESAV